MGIGQLQNRLSPQNFVQKCTMDKQKIYEILIQNLKFFFSKTIPQIPPEGGQNWPPQGQNQPPLLKIRQITLKTGTKQIPYNTLHNNDGFYYLPYQVRRG